MGPLREGIVFARGAQNLLVAGFFSGVLKAKTRSIVGETGG
jgi:hypothetical protein